MKKVLVGCLVAFGLFVVFFGFLIWYFGIRETPILTGVLIYPREVKAGEDFTFDVVASNRNTTRVELDSIDIDDELLAGFQIVSIEPDPKDTLSIFGMRTWMYDMPVDAGTSITVRFTLKPLQAGHYRGEVDVCNDSQDYESELADIVVKPAGKGGI